MSELVALALAAALAHGVDGALFCRLIEAESGWRIDAVSESGCKGLGQLNPRVYVLEDYFDPAANLDKSAEALAWNMAYWRRTVGDEAEVRRLAVASYNLGYYEVRALRDAHGNQWREALSPEVRRYVKRITVTEVLSGQGWKGQYAAM